MQLNKQNLHQIKRSFFLEIPHEKLFTLPEKIIQFGTGVLLRGLTDFYIDKANKQGIFNGRIVVVKSTGSNIGSFVEQDCLYTHCIKGINDKNIIKENIINASISRVLVANKEWETILKCAEDKNISIIISNTTEVGISLNTHDNITAIPPESFPGKLLSFLYRRYKFFNGNKNCGFVIIPTELIVENGNKLKQVLIELAIINKLEQDFIDWIETANDFCNSLVDRIVPGALKNNEKQLLENNAGYTDELAIMSEPYSLWAIETRSHNTKNILSFSKADENIIIAEDINKYRELKLRLLNGTHTYCCGLAFLAGFEFVNDAMRDETMQRFVHQLMFTEIIGSILNVNEQQAIAFAKNVIDRFSNPFLQHKWLSITMQYTTKMKMRNIPLLLTYFKQNNKVPLHMAAGFAAYILFMKPIEKKEKKYYGNNNGFEYLIDDDKAEYFYELWNKNNADAIVRIVLNDVKLWDDDLMLLSGFYETVLKYLKSFINNDFKKIVTAIDN